MLNIALTGNPNAGKTTLFNALTGGHQHVGNYPGITVEKKTGYTKLSPDEEARIIDLPGTYSLTAYTQEETVTRQVLVEERPDVVIAVLNGVALERNLYLAVQLLELEVPLVLALNMMDEVRSKGMRIDLKRLSSILNLPIVETVARQGQGINELKAATLELAKTKQGENKHLEISYGPDLDPVLISLTAKITEANLLPAYPRRWLGLKLLEQDLDIIERAKAANATLTEQLLAEVKAVNTHLEATLGSNAEAVLSDYRYGYVASILRNKIVQRPKDSLSRFQLSDKLDSILTQRLLGPLIMLLILYLMYTITFNLGSYPMTLVESMFGWLRELGENTLPEGAFKSLVLSGIIDGVGGVMSFVPLIMIIFLQISFLEDSGYMARMAYMLDRIFRIFGLHGCSVMPFVISGGIAGGCAVPGVMASRTLRSPREKIATILTVPFMACGAKLPVFILFAGIFFPNYEALVMFGLTLSGWLVAMLVAKLLRSTLIKGPSTPFVMELPPYRLPTLQGLLIHCLERTWEYLKKAGTVILAISILIWAAMTYPGLDEKQVAEFVAKQTQLEQAITETPNSQPKSQLADANMDHSPAFSPANQALRAQLELLEQHKSELSLRQSIAGRLGLALEPYTLPAGFDWRTDIALLGGFAAKEVIVATLGTAYSLGDVDPEASSSLAEKIKEDGNWNTANALAFLVFVLLYAPCLVTLVVIRQETGSMFWAIFSLTFNTALAFGLAVVVRQLVLLI